ncbi:fla cluster protein FlaF [Haloarchaeobius sp. HME9146]|uniref:fla cluster protein FlaF n=1 Tax=Haloarchaeobius sp. HME9146 TaxID=2978732 RepID=UPI0021BE2781|nr:fla cluster protein FlaF [Haloarchaeobius sp. HME9146]MCT9095207.1 fla cluster protein FlaF [Haloarchaeobius sp. HME9146]
MGLSISGAAAILFVGVLLTVSTAVPVLESANERVTTAVDDRGERELERRNTDMNVTNVTYNASADTLTVNVTNTGSRTLSVNETDLLVDGVYRTDATTRVEGDSGRVLWMPGESLEFELTGITTTPDRVKVVTEYGVAETITEV